MAMEVVGARVNSIEGKHNPGKKMNGFEIGIGIEDVRVTNERVEVDYKYLVKYRDDLGEIVINGTIFLKDSADQLKKIEDDWKKSKKLPADYSKTLTSLVPRLGTVHGIMLGRVLDLPAPLPPFKIEKAIVHSSKK